MYSDGARRCAILASLLGLVSACGSTETSAIHSISPEIASARGGEPVVIEGEGFADGASVSFGGEMAEVVRQSDDRIEVSAPTHLAALVEVSVTNPDGTVATLPEAFTYEPLELAFARAADHHFPDLSELVVSDAVAADFDGDGAQDVLLAVRNAPPRLLTNSGAGTFLDLAGLDDGAVSQPWWVHDTSSMLVEDFDGDGAQDVFLCNRGGQSSRLAVNDGQGELAIAEAALPTRADDCRAAVLADLDGDGHRDLVVLGRGEEAMGSSYLRVYLRAADELRFEVADSLEQSAEMDGVSCAEAGCGSLELEPAELPVTYLLSQEQAAAGSGAGEIHFDFSVTPGSATVVWPVPATAAATAVALDVEGDGSGVELTAVLTDAEGERFSQVLGVVDFQGWKRLVATDVAAWPGVGGNEDGVVDLPIATLSLSLRSETTGPAGQLRIDDVTLNVAGTGEVLIEGFERTDFELSWAEPLSAVVAGDLDGDGDVDLLVSSAAADADRSVRLILNVGQGPLQLQEMPVGGLAAVSERVTDLALMDADADGDLDLVTVAGAEGQDRLLINDGNAHFFDDSSACMPVDRAAGRALEVADLDMDGHTDLIVANHQDANRLYLGRGDRGFVDATPTMPVSESKTKRVLPFDADGDGDIDLLELNEIGEPSVLFVSTTR